MTSGNPHQILGLGPRCKAWLRQQYPKNRGKLIARDFGVHENTAWRWLSGRAPTTAHLEEMYGRWGLPWLEFVFVEAFERQDARLGHLHQIDTEISRLEARRAELDEARIRWLEARRAERELAHGAESVGKESMAQRAPPAQRSDLDGPIEARRQILDQLAKEIPQPSLGVLRHLGSVVMNVFRRYFRGPV